MRDARAHLIIRALACASLLIVFVLLARGQLFSVVSIEPLAPPLDTASVIVAGTDLPSGTRLVARVVRTAAWPRSELPEGAFASIEALEGRVLRYPVPEGQPIIEAFLLPRVPVQIVAV